MSCQQIKTVRLSGDTDNPALLHYQKAPLFRMKSTIILGVVYASKRGWELLPRFDYKILIFVVRNSQKSCPATLMCRECSSSEPFFAFFLPLHSDFKCITRGSYFMVSSFFKGSFPKKGAKKGPQSFSEKRPFDIIILIYKFMLGAVVSSFS